MRERLHGWFDQASVDDKVAFDLVTACTEAFNNSVEHPLDATRNSIEVDARLNERTVVITIRDYGQWRHTPAGNRGHKGFPLMRGLVDLVAVSQGITGTVVTLTREL